MDSLISSKNIFHKTADINFQLFISNQLYQDISYSYKGSPFCFEIWHSDTLFATSLDYVPM